MLIGRLIARLVAPDCYRVARVLQSYLDGEIDAATAGDVQAHLERCRHCGLEASTYRAIKRAIGSGPARTGATPHVDDDVLARLSDFASSLGAGPHDPGA